MHGTYRWPCENNVDLPGRFLVTYSLLMRITNDYRGFMLVALDQPLWHSVLYSTANRSPSQIGLGCRTNTMKSILQEGVYVLQMLFMPLCIDLRHLSCSACFYKQVGYVTVTAKGWYRTRSPIQCDHF